MIANHWLIIEIRTRTCRNKWHKLHGYAAGKFHLTAFYRREINCICLGSYNSRLARWAAEGHTWQLHGKLVTKEPNDDQNIFDKFSVSVFSESFSRMVKSSIKLSCFCYRWIYTSPTVPMLWSTPCQLISINGLISANELCSIQIEVQVSRCS